MEAEGSRFVDYDTYCKTCAHTKKKETEEPCDVCLDNPTNAYTEKPVKWEAQKLHSSL